MSLVLPAAIVVVALTACATERQTGVTSDQTRTERSDSDDSGYEETDYEVGYKVGSIAGVPNGPVEPGVVRTANTMCRTFYAGLQEAGRQADPADFMKGCRDAYRELGITDPDEEF